MTQPCISLESNDRLTLHTMAKSQDSSQRSKKSRPFPGQFIQKLLISRFFKVLHFELEIQGCVQTRTQLKRILVNSLVETINYNKKSMSDNCTFTVPGLGRVTLDGISQSQYPVLVLDRSNLVSVNSYPYSSNLLSCSEKGVNKHNIVWYSITVC